MLIYELSFRQEEFREGRTIGSEAQRAMDQIDKRYLTDVVFVLAILLITVLAYARFQNPSVLFAGSLGLTLFVIADIIFNR